jgi:ribosome-binding factor A
MNPRLPQVNQLLQEELGSILLREFDLPDGVLVTVTRVVTSGNLQEAKVYISVMPEAKLQEVFGALGKNIYAMQQMLNKRLRMRPVPRIRWAVETKTSEAQKIEELLARTREKK